MLRYLFSALFFTGTIAAYAVSPTNPIPYEEPQEIIIHNRILAKVGSKTISVLDLVKKMDIFLNATYPQAMGSKLARYQFYKSNWRNILEQMIDGELILNDVGEKDLKISEGEIREGILKKFGPNVMAALDKCGLTYEEAKKMQRDELTVQRMVWFKVHAKALQQVRPQEIREEYQEYVAQHPSEEEWTYQVISIRSQQQKVSEQLAHEAFSLLHNAKVDFASLKDLLEERKKTDEISYTISDVLTANDRSISDAHRRGLEGLKEGQCSLPISQTSGNEKNPVQRIFFLKHHGIKPIPSFQVLKEDLKQKCLDEMVSKEDLVYKQKLRVRYGHFLVLEDLPPSFEPFSLEFNQY